MKKLLEAIPNSLIVIGGIAAVLLLLSPFLVEMFSGRPKTGGVTLQEDSENLPGLAAPKKKPVRSSQTMQLLPQAELLNHHAGITLDASVAELGKRFTLRLVNRDNSNPQIYDARGQQGLDCLRATFYDGKLKEFVVVYPPRVIDPENLADDLFTEFGQVPSWLRGREEETARVGAVTADLIEKLLGYPRARQLAWSDGDNRVDATIYSRMGGDVQAECVLAIQISAAQWIKDYKAKQESGIAAPLPENTKPEGGVTEPSGPNQ